MVVGSVDIVVVKKQERTDINDTIFQCQILTTRLVRVFSVFLGELGRLEGYNHLNTSNREVLFPAGKESSKSYS